jgi:hypothetical protein
MPPGFYRRTQADTRQITRQTSGGEFGALRAIIVFVLFLSPDVSPKKHVEDDGRLCPALDRK